MKYPGILLLPLLMFANYFLMVLGAIQGERKHALHFKLEDNEANPLRQKSIRRKKWFNLRDILSTIAICAILVWYSEFGDLPDRWNQFFLGALLVMYGFVVGRHINNLLLFRHLVKHPDQISGEITMSHHLTLGVSLYQTIPVLIPVGLIAVFSGSNFARGGLLGVVVISCGRLAWIWRAKRKAATMQHAQPGVAPVVEESSRIP